MQHGFFNKNVLTFDTTTGVEVYVRTEYMTQHDHVL